MEVKKIWRVQFIIAWVLLVVAVIASGMLLSTGATNLGVVILIGGMVIALISGILMWQLYRCPNCRRSLNRRMLGDVNSAGLVKCPHCAAMLREV